MERGSRFSNENGVWPKKEINMTLKCGGGYFPLSSRFPCQSPQAPTFQLINQRNEQQNVIRLLLLDQHCQLRVFIRSGHRRTSGSNTSFDLGPPISAIIKNRN